MAVVCNQLGYKASTYQRLMKPAVGSLKVSSKPSWPFYVNCYGNESTIDDCQLIPASERCKPSREVRLRCTIKTWGGLRFTTITETQPYEKQSVLEHVELWHAGLRQHTVAAGIETVFSVPRMKYVSVINCSSGGLTIFAPNENVLVEESTFLNTGKTSFIVVQSRKKTVLHRIISSHTEHGIAFPVPDIKNIPNQRENRPLCFI